MSLNETVTLNIAGNAQQALKAINTQLGAVNKSFNTMRNVLGTLALGGFVQNVFSGAQAIQDLSDQTGIAVQSIVGISEAFRLNASSAEAAFASISKFTQNIGEAKNGNEQLIQSFKQVGISFEELFTNTAEQNILKALKGLGEIKNKSDQARIATDLLGKNSKANFAGIASSVEKSIEASARTAAGITAADQAAENFETTITNLKNELLAALKPFSEFASQINISAEAIQKFIKIAGTLVLVIGTATALGRAGKFVISVFGSLVNAGKSLKTTIDVLSHYWKRLTNQIEVKKPKNTLFEGISKSIGYLIGALGSLIGALGTIAAFVMPDTLLEFFKDLGQILGIVDDEATASAKAIEKLNKASFDAHKAAREQAQAEKEAAEKAREAMASMTAEKIKGIDALAKGYKKAFADTIADIKLQTEQLTSSDDANLIAQNLKKIQDEYDLTKQKLTEQLDLLALKPKDKLTIFDEQEIKRLKIALTELEKDYVAAMESVTGASLDLIKAQDDIEFAATQNRIALEQYQDKLVNDEVLQQLKDEASLIGLTGKELKIREAILKIEQDTRQKVNTEMVRLRDLELQINDARKKGNEIEAQRLQLELDAQKAKIDAIKRSGEAQKKQTKDNIKTEEDAQKSVMDGILKRLEETKESLTKFKLGETLADGLINAIDEFVRTGKFKFKDFAANALREWAAMKAKLAAIDLFENIFNSLKKAIADKILGSIIAKIFGSFLGFAKGGEPPVNQVSVVGEKGPELFVPKQAGTIIPNNKVKDFLASVNQFNDDTTKNMTMMTRSMRSFANGGKPPINQTSLVGEKGPELFIPDIAKMQQRETSRGPINAPVTNNYNTYNISALDAKSVAQLFAENRKAIFGANKMAEREMSYAGVR